MKIIFLLFPVLFGFSLLAEESLPTTNITVTDAAFSCSSDLQKADIKDLAVQEVTMNEKSVVLTLPTINKVNGDKTISTTSSCFETIYVPDQKTSQAIYKLLISGQKMHLYFLPTGGRNGGIMTTTKDFRRDTFHEVDQQILLGSADLRSIYVYDFKERKSVTLEDKIR